nr:hypothetical protein [Soonwooa sp.]
MKTKPNLLRVNPPICKSVTNFGTTGTNCEQATVDITQNTMDVNIHDNTTLLLSSFFSSKNSLMEASR